jgi:hypothetical protein
MTDAISEASFHGGNIRLVSGSGVKKTAVMPILIVLGLGAIASAGAPLERYSLEGIDTADFVNSNSVVRDAIESFMRTDRGIYTLGEDVQMLFKITNLTNDDVTITANHGPAFNLFARGDGQTVWMKHYVFTMALVPVDLAPGEWAGTSANWDMTYGDGWDPNYGNTVGAGIYDVGGRCELERRAYCTRHQCRT